MEISEQVARSEEVAYEVPMLVEIGEFGDLTRGLPAGVREDDAFQYQ